MATVRFTDYARAVEAARLLAQSGLNPANARLVEREEAAYTGSSDGSYDILVDINFGNKSIGGGNSRIDVNSLLVFGSLPILTQSFATGSGTASFTQSGIMGLGGSICPTPCSTSITIAPQNSGGVAGATMNHSVFITGDPSSSSGSGTATRQPGSAPPPG